MSKSKSLIIVESPTKAKTIKRYLGDEYEVIASYGHVRDLPNSAAEVPEKFKKLGWAKLGINVEENFEPLYVIPEDKKKRVKELKESLKDAKELLLATDEDREGESISWHLVEVLAPKIPYQRLVFNEITKETIKGALNKTRTIDENLVRAQETRRIVDRLFGYTVSPLLWKKMAPKLSAGRVQSVALRLLVEREKQRISFVSSEFWDLVAKLKKNGSDVFPANITHYKNQKIADGKDFDSLTGKLNKDSKALWLDEKKSKELKNSLSKLPPIVESVEEKPFTQKPSPPFTTSTLQQDASKKFYFGAQRTMQLAQKLYENGFITYMRTDSTSLSQEALTASRNLIQEQYGKDFLPSEPRLYKTKVKNAQEAHEAIRPAGINFTPIKEVFSAVGDEAGRLYELIWKRTMASQMNDAEGVRVSVKVSISDAIFRASGKTITFPGFLRAYVEGSDDPEADLAEQERILPKLSVGDKLILEGLDALQHNTQAPARYTEGSLIKQLEHLGIGRPSTWATIVNVVLSRTYAFKKGTALVPTFLAMAVIRLMESHLSNVIDYDFTARLEEDLDSISRGEEGNLDYLKNFYLGKQPGLKELVTKGEELIDPRLVCGLDIGVDSEGRKIEVRIGRYGPFLTNGEARTGLPAELPPDELDVAKATEILALAEKGPDSLGVHPDSGLPIFLKSGRFGPYVQEGEVEAGSKTKPKMASLLAGMNPEEIDLDTAVQLLSLPKNLGKHPELNEDIIVQNGKFGPYLTCGGENRSLNDLSPLTITLSQCVELLKQPKSVNRRTTASKPLKEFGVHPVTEKNITLKNGRFGPYITDGKVNVSLPKDRNIEVITLEDAIELIDSKSPPSQDKKKKAIKTSKVKKKKE
jgi:DNA topoisomerase I